MGGANAGGGRSQAAPSGRPWRRAEGGGRERRAVSAGPRAGLDGEGAPGRGSPLSGVGYEESEGQREATALLLRRVGRPPPPPWGWAPHGGAGPGGTGWARAVRGRFLGGFGWVFFGFISCC